jgi:hypothetical protein
MGNRAERFPVLMKELNTQGIVDYELWPGVYLPSIKASINAAHKQIVEYARLAEWDEVMIAEDDIKFSSVNGVDYFLKQKPNDFDIYLGGLFLGDPDEKNVVKTFTGLTLYVVARRFYDTFLTVPDDDHLDRLLDGLGRYVVCNPFVVTQHDGVSGNTGKFEIYGGLTKNRTFL